MLAVSMVSFFERESPRRKILEALVSGDKNLQQLADVAQFRAGKAYVWRILESLKEKGLVEKHGEGKVILWRLTKEGKKFLGKETIDKVI